MNLLARATILVVSVLVIISSSVAADGPEALTRIIGGVEVLPGDFQWMASLYRTGSRPTSDTGGHFCGGTLIAPRYVLTAAHCVDSLSAGALSVAVGQVNLSEFSLSEESRVKKITIHPRYTSPAVSNDIAMLELERPLLPVGAALVLSSERDYWLPGRLATIIGWGTSDPIGQSVSNALRRANVPLRSDQECRERMGPNYDQNMICAGVLSSGPGVYDGVDGCYGDSGGPLFVSDKAGGWRVVGISSWGYACASDIYYGVYTKVASFRRWLSSLLPPPRAVISSGGCRGRACRLIVRAAARSGGSSVAQVAARGVFVGTRAAGSGRRNLRTVRLRRNYQARQLSAKRWRFLITAPGYGQMALRILAYEQNGVPQRRQQRATIRPMRGRFTRAQF